MAFADDPIAGDTLIRPAVRSPDYNPNTAGWSIERTGYAEFNNANVRGTLNADTLTVAGMYPGYGQAGGVSNLSLPTGSIGAETVVFSPILTAKAGRAYLARVGGSITGSQSAGAYFQLRNVNISGPVIVGTGIIVTLSGWGVGLDGLMWMMNNTANDIVKSFALTLTATAGTVVWNAGRFIEFIDVGRSADYAFRAVEL